MNCDFITLLIAYQIFYASVECSSPAGMFSHSEPVDWPDSLLLFSVSLSIGAHRCKVKALQTWNESYGVILIPPKVCSPFARCVFVYVSELITVAACVHTHCSVTVGLYLGDEPQSQRFRLNTSC